MSDRTDTESKFIDVDLDQWRQDIDTFAAATTSALDTILTELSTACSGDSVRTTATTTQTQSTAKPNPIPRQGNNITSPARPVAPRNSTDKSSAPSNSGGRLASLKEKLASRLNKSQTPPRSVPLADETQNTTTNHAR